MTLRAWWLMPMTMEASDFQRPSGSAPGMANCLFKRSSRAVGLALLGALLLSGPAWAGFKKVNKDANPPTNLEYEVSYEFPFKDNNSNQVWTTKVTVKNTDNANDQKVMLCLQGISHPLKTGTQSRDLINISFDNNAKRLQCRPANRAEDKDRRYGCLGCELATIKKNDMETFLFVAGQRPRDDAPAPIPVQDGKYRDSMNGAGRNGPGHRTATLKTFKLGNKDVRVVRQAIDELRLHFFVLKDTAIDMACRKNFVPAGAEPAYTPPCAAANQFEQLPACNLGFGMNFEFALPKDAIRGVTVHKETVKWNPADLKNVGATLTQLDIPFGVETPLVETTPTPFSAYLRLTPPDGLPSTSFSVSPPDNTYFTVLPGSSQFGTLTLDLFDPDFSGDFIITVRKAETTDIPPADRDIQADEVVVENLVPVVPSMVCDVNRDNAVDIDDITEIFVYRGLPTTPPDPYDLDGDGIITVNDARICATKCSKRDCEK